LQRHYGSGYFRMRPGKQLAVGLACSVLLAAAEWVLPVPMQAATPLQMAPFEVGVYENGLALYSRGSYTGAFGYFLRAIHEDPKNINARYYLADTLVKLDRRTEAETQYRKIMEIAPHSQASRLSILALAQLRQDRDPKAMPQWRQGSSSTDGGPSDRYTGYIAEGDTYLERVGEGFGLTRWSLLTMPLKVYIETSPVGIRNFQPSFINQVRRGLDAWVNALDHQLSYALQTVPDNADIKITWVNTIDTRGHSGDGGTSYTAGLTTPNIRDGQLVSMGVNLATFNIVGEPQNDGVIYAVAVHEMGHALGLLGHSEHPEDIMYAHNQSVLQPSPRDIRTIRRLYASVVAIDNRPVSQRPAQSAKEAEVSRQEMAKRMDDRIRRLEEQSQKESTALNWLNLGVAYFQKARRIESAPPEIPSASDKPDANVALPPTPKDFYQKALTAINRSIQQEPDDPRAYHRRSLVYQAMQNYPSALSDIQSAISHNRREPEYYMLQAWYLSQLGRKAEGQDSLNTYLLYKPGEANSNDVLQIKKAITAPTQ
jgi:tetratricopeptide (TPR) repeat protein